MQRYLTPLIEDLAAISCNSPEAPATETPPRLAHDPVIAELLQSPFNPIAQWPCIDKAVKYGGSVRLEIAGTIPVSVRSS